MSFLSRTLHNVTKGARLGTDVAVWSAHYISRYATAGSRGVCVVCNNLQPHGHEDTFGRKGARFIVSTSSSEDMVALRKAAADVPTLVLQGIETQTLLEVREIDSQTGLPKRDCRYCRLLCDILDAFFIDEYMSWITETANKMGPTIGLMIREGQPLIINCWRLTYDKHIQDPQVDLELYVNSTLPLHALPEDIPKVGHVRPRASSSGTWACRQFYKECVSQCSREHVACRERQTDFVPTRLLYIGDEDSELRVCVPTLPSQQIRWAALSHCWGDGQPLKLLTENYEQLTRKVDYDDLPMTFKNAIEVARELDSRYVWVDSLCIMQNDRADWEKEAMTMGKIHSDAFVVISGASSPNPQTPFLGPRDDEWMPKQFDYTSADGTVVPLVVRQRHMLAAPLEQGIYEPPFTSAWASLKRVGPLYTRAWCFQETYLARRVLHFAPGAIIFECRTHRRSEDQLPPYPLLGPGSLGNVEDMVKWQYIVKNYTQRQLTFARDKLPAIGGSASPMLQARRTEYLAGLWRESLLLDLMWQVMPGGTHLDLSYPKSDQAAPSWSWASVNRGVTWNTLEKPELLAEVISAEVSYRTNPFGEVHGGRLILRGHVIPCWIQTSRRNANEQWIYYGPQEGSKCQKRNVRIDGCLASVAKPGNTGFYARRGVNNFEELTERYFLCIARTPWLNYNYVGLALSSSAGVDGCLENESVAR